MLEITNEEEGKKLVKKLQQRLEDLENEHMHMMREIAKLQNNDQGTWQVPFFIAKMVLIYTWLMEVILYSKDNCQWCDRARMLFDAVSVKYIEYKYQKDFTKEQFYDEFGEGSTFPQVSINTKHIGGFKDTLHYFQENNLI